MHLSGFVNIDIDPKCEPDLVLETENLHSAFPRDSVQQIVIIHGLNYLSFNDAKRFFRDALELLKVGGTLIIENPCAEKFSPGLASGDPEVFAESAFALLAVNENGYTHATSYKFVWSSEALERELMRAGFSAVTTENPKFHGGRAERDARFIASR
jgi:predicted SAM-dependent methyltransferase